MTKQEEIIQAILVRLRDGLAEPEFSPAVPPPPGLKAPHRSPTRPFEEDELPTYAVMVAQNNQDDGEGEYNQPDGPFKRVLWVYLEARALGDPEDADGAPDKYLDPLVEYAYTVLLSDPQLGGLCNHIEPERVVYEAYDGRQVYLAAAMLFRVYYLGDPL